MTHNWSRASWTPPYGLPFTFLPLTPQQVRVSLVPGLPIASPSPFTPSVLQHLPVWPSTRLPWPTPCKLLEEGSLGGLRWLASAVSLVPECRPMCSWRDPPLHWRIGSLPDPWCPIGDKCHPGARHSVQMVNHTVAVLTRMVLPCPSPTGAHPELTSGRSLCDSDRFCGREAVGSQEKRGRCSQADGVARAPKSWLRRWGSLLKNVFFGRRERITVRITVRQQSPNKQKTPPQVEAATGLTNVAPLAIS